jgi:outer membrane lipoprotein-sorting protein
LRHLKLLLIIIRYFSLIISLIILISSQAVSSDQQKLLKTKIENFFVSLNTLEADFIQVSPSGNISNGKIFIDLPGKLRLDYNKPSNLLITCKGFWLVVQDRKRKSTNNIPLQQTPFSILLDKKINFNNNKIILDLKKSLGIISLKVQLAENVKAGELILEFSDNPFILKKWIIKDIIGDETTVLIQNTKFGHKLPFELFFPEDFPEPND